MNQRIETFTKLMRPVFGYIVALSWGAQMFAVAFVIVFKTESAAGVINAMGSLATGWAAGLSVLGIYVYRRSSEKLNFYRGEAETTESAEKDIKNTPHSLTTPRLRGK